MAHPVDTNSATATTAISTMLTAVANCRAAMVTAKNSAPTPDVAHHWAAQIAALDHASTLLTRTV